VLWVGVWLLAFRGLKGWEHLALFSPVLTYFLLTRISGIPLLERKADKKWGEEATYKEYKTKTPVLFPNPIVVVRHVFHYLTNKTVSSKANSKEQ